MKNYLNIPYALILFRLLCAPAIILLAYFGGSSFSNLILLLMYLGLISDILDGIIARNIGIADDKMRRMDSQTDMLFWLSIAFSTWILRSDIIKPYLIAVFFLFATEALCYLVSIIRFKKETCTHAYLSKIWGICLLMAFTSLIGFSKGGFFFFLALIVGYLSHLDRILITLLIPKWTHDIPSTYHAWLLRQGKTFKKIKLFN